MRLNRRRVIPGRGCGVGVVGRVWVGLLPGRAVSKPGVSRRALEGVTVDGESPVGENVWSVWHMFPE